MAKRKITIFTGKHKEGDELAQKVKGKRIHYKHTKNHKNYKNDKIEGKVIIDDIDNYERLTACHQQLANLYPVFAQLMNNGFENISAQPVKDIDDSSTHYEFEVAQLSIGGNSAIKKDSYFPYNVDVVITYHVKKEIKLPFMVKSLFRQNYSKTLHGGR